MKLGRISVLAVAGVMTVGALVGIAGAGKASAALMTPTPLCIDSTSVGNVCLYDAGSAGFGSRAFWSAISPGKWTYPNSDGAFGRITSNSNYCLQINHSDSNFVRYATCSTSDSELWINYYNPSTRRTEFVSYWNLFDNDGNFLCMSEDYNGGNRLVKADPCTPGGGTGGTSHWYQQFGTT
jgi:hypothetical protein